MGQRNFKHYFNSTISVKCFTVAWPDMNLGVFIQCQYRRTILRNGNMGQTQEIFEILKISIKQFYFDLFKRGENE